MTRLIQEFKTNWRFLQEDCSNAEQIDFDDANWETELMILRIQLDSQRTRDWWTRLGRNYSSHDFGQVVDQIIQDEPATDELWSMPTSWSSE